MCGITGAIWTDANKAVDAAALGRMTDMLAHRGPDDSGAFCSDLFVDPPYPARPGVALGHRRLSIIDPAGSRQPLSNEDGSIQLVFNGEIYNYRALRQRLEGSGHTFRTTGDSETIVHLYEDEGPGFAAHLHGMFSLALWDSGRRRLVLARDRLGQKPLVYRVEPGRLLFASELKSLLAHGQVPREIDPAAVDEYLTHDYVPHPNTIFRGVHKLPPAHYAIFENDRLSIAPYWSPDFNHEASRPAVEWREGLRSRLTESVRDRMQADVPLGAFLSGGVDSSIIVALMQQQSSRPVKTFSIGFPVAEYDESSFARRVADHLGTEHHEFQVEPRGIDILPKLVWHYDEPFADSSAIPTWYVSEHTRREVKVALTGDGGDELFAGYERYRAVRLGARIDRLPGVLRSMIAARTWQRLPASPRQKGFMRRIKRFAEAAAMPAPRRYAEWITTFNESRRASLYTDEFLAQLPNSDPVEFLTQAYSRSAARDPVTSASLADLVTYLPCDLMTKVDIASMAHGLECRQPFLDHAVVEWAAAMPIRCKLRGRRAKRILEETFGDLIPRDIFRRRKMGFGVPLDHWFRDELKDFAHDVLLDPAALGRGYFRPAAIEQLLREHTTGVFDHAQRLWSLLFFELWQREWVDGA
jgi:asparagine synthase (glutamine-hydrolysing)